MSQDQLQEFFDYLNVQLFEGILPKIEIRWRDTRSRGGYFVFRTVSFMEDGKRKYKKIPLYIEISSYFARTDDAVRGILAHEMIHYYIAHKMIMDDGQHGRMFHKILRELNAKRVVHIPFMVDDPDI